MHPWQPRWRAAVAMAGAVMLAVTSPAVGVADEPIPPAPTARSGEPAPGIAWHRPLLVVGLGDSVPGGAGCDCDTYIDLVARGLGGPSRIATAIDFAFDGAQTVDLWDDLDNPQEAEVIADADVIVVTVGANDLDSDLPNAPVCEQADPLRCYEENVQPVELRLMETLRALRARAHPQARLVVTGYGNAFLDGPVGAARGAQYVAGAQAVTRALNARIARVAAAVGARYVDVYASVAAPERVADPGDLLESDGDHPNAAGHRAIADAVLAALR